MSSLSKVYLLRLWAEPQNGRLVWRFRLENPRTGESWHFASQEAFDAFLSSQLVIEIDHDHSSTRKD